jgi:hypothetical protein
MYKHIYIKETCNGKIKMKEKLRKIKKIKNKKKIKIQIK